MLHAGFTQTARVPVHCVFFRLNVMDAFGADFDAAAAPHTSFAQQYRFGPGASRLRTVAPAARKWAAFEVDGQPYAGSIVHSEGVEVEDESLDMSGVAHEEPSWRRM